MEILETKGVVISVEAQYQPEMSVPLQNYFLFSYNITIQNNNDFPIQILKRHWFITDNLNNLREVEGEGVVGLQPIIPKNHSFNYTSSCNFHTDIGQMHGYYLAKNIITERLFYIDIPKFILIAPMILN